MRARIFYLLLGSLLGCAPTNPGIDVVGLVAPDEMCLLAPGNPFVSFPVLDVSPPTGGQGRLAGRAYAAAFLVENEFNNNAGTFPLSANTHDWHALDAEVTLFQSDGETPFAFADLPNPYRVPASGYAAAGMGSGMAGQGIVNSVVVPDAYGAALNAEVAGGGANQQIVVGVNITGRTSGDETQTAGGFSFVLTLCSGCLYGCMLDETGNPVTSYACMPGQDKPSSICP